MIDNNNGNIISKEDGIDPNVKKYIQNKEKEVKNQNKVKGILYKMIVISFSYMVIEYIVAVIANSTAIKSDSFHMLADASGYLIQLLSIIFSTKGSNCKKYSFNYYRLEIVGGFINIGIILFLSIVLLLECYDKLSSGHLEVNSGLMILTSFTELLINLTIGKIAYGNQFLINIFNDALVMLRLKSKNDIIVTAGTDNLGRNFNYKTAVLHLLSDMLYSFSIFTVSLLIFFIPGLVFLDPLCGILYFVIMSKMILELLRSGMKIILEGNPLDENTTNDIIKEIRSIKGVKDIHNLHIWGLTTEKFCIMCHILISETASKTKILNECSKIALKHEISHFNFQLEKSDKNCFKIN